MTSSYKVTLPVPPSVNRMYRVFRGRVFLVKQGKDYKAIVSKSMSDKYGLDSALEGPVAVVVKVYRAAKRGDLDNFMKCLLDGLQGTAYKNDKQIVEMHSYRYDDKLNPRVEVQIYAVQ